MKLFKLAMLSLAALIAVPAIQSKAIDRAFIKAVKCRNTKAIDNILPLISDLKTFKKSLMKAVKDRNSDVVQEIVPLVKSDVKFVKIINKALKAAASRGFYEICKYLSPLADDKGRATANKKLISKMRITQEFINNNNILPKPAQVAATI